MAFFAIEVTSRISRFGEFVTIGIMEADNLPQVREKLGKADFAGRSDMFSLPPEWEARLKKDVRGEIPKFSIYHFPTIESLADVLLELDKRGYLEKKPQ